MNLDTLELRSLIDKVDSRSWRCSSRHGNVILSGFAEQWIRLLGNGIREIHMKDFRRQVGNIHGFVLILAGDVKLPAVAAAARETGFSGFRIAEQFPYLYHGDAILEHTVLALNRILADHSHLLAGQDS